VAPAKRAQARACVALARRLVLRRHALACQLVLVARQLRLGLRLLRVRLAQLLKVRALAVRSAARRGSLRLRLARLQLLRARHLLLLGQLQHLRNTPRQRPLPRAARDG
jgi:hypothetical protein